MRWANGRRVLPLFLDPLLGLPRKIEPATDDEITFSENLRFPAVRLTVTAKRPGAVAR